MNRCCHCDRGRCSCFACADDDRCCRQAKENVHLEPQRPTTFELRVKALHEEHARTIAHLTHIYRCTTEEYNQQIEELTQKRTALQDGIDELIQELRRDDRQNATLMEDLNQCMAGLNGGKPA